MMRSGYCLPWDSPKAPLTSSPPIFQPLSNPQGASHFFSPYLPAPVQPPRRLSPLLPLSSSPCPTPKAPLTSSPPIFQPPSNPQGALTSPPIFQPLSNPQGASHLFSPYLPAPVQPQALAALDHGWPPFFPRGSQRRCSRSPPLVSMDRFSLSSAHLGVETSLGPVSSQPVPETHSLPGGDSAFCQGLCPLGDVHRPFGCLLPHPHSPWQTTLAPCCVG